jgi:PGAP1-like protein
VNRFDAVIAAALVAAHGVEQVTGLVEDVHGRIARPGWRRRGEVARTGGISGLVYRGIRLVTRGTSGALRMLGGRGRGLALSGARRESAVRAVVNGLIGDHLAETGNALAIPMVLRRGGQTLPLERAALAAALPDAMGRVVVLIHGLCMNDLQWDPREIEGQEGQKKQEGRGGHGQALARDLGCTSVYLHYNTGRHISQNGRELGALLEALVGAWPVPVEQLAIVCHSMGGMVARSACHYAAQAGYGWPAKLRKLVFLGTPHHGSPLERHGNAFETVLASIPYAAPFAKLGRLRGAGITDLRHGNLLDEDWHGSDRFERTGDARGIVPLPEAVDCYTIAATDGKEPDGLGARVWGDGLVGVRSALGEHQDQRRALSFPASNRWVAYGIGHFALLHHPDVYERLRDWLAD